MKEKSERNVNLVARLEKIRLSRAWTWTDLQNELRVSKTLLHFLRTGERGLSPKVERRLRELEACVSAGGSGQVLAVTVGSGHVGQEWMEELRERWQAGTPEERAEITVFVRHLWPKSSAAIIRWLSKTP